jgi:hypothetical protein
MNALHGGNMPPWLSALGVKSGEYFVDSKPRARRAMRSEFFSPAARIHICLGLATMGFQQELAVKMECGKRVPLTPADVCEATGIDRKHFRRYMDELEAYGLAECRGSTKNRVELYSWALPRELNKENIVTARGDNSSVSAITCTDGGPVSEALISTLRRLKIQAGFVAARGDIAEAERLAWVAKEAELSLRAHVERLRATGAPIRKKETEINIEINDERAYARQAQEAPAPERESSHSSVVSPHSERREKLRTWLTSPGRELFGLQTAPDDAVLDRIVAHVTDETTFDLFTMQLTRQRPRPDSWMYLVPIAEACAKARRAESARETNACRPENPPGFDEALAARLGDGSIDSFRAVTGDREASFEDQEKVYESLCAEFGVAFQHRLARSD